MSEKKLFQDKSYLREQQYKDSSNLDARAALHRQFSTSKTDWHPWVFDQMSLQSNSRVLECGCGPGWLWRSSLERIPSDCHITLSDLSSGMVAEAKAALADSAHRFSFEVVNVEELPFENKQFDIVVANHMLYHVPDRAKALGEIRRVLKDNGRLLAATNGQKHLQEIGQFGAKLFPKQIKSLQKSRLQRTQGMAHTAFGLENGRQQLAPFFSHIDLLEYEDGLRITKVAPLIAYILSMASISDISNEILETLTSFLEQELAKHGSIYISKESGLFIAKP